MTPPEPLLIGEAVVRLYGREHATARAIRLASCPGLAAVEVGFGGSWVVVHEASGSKISPQGEYVAPWPEAVRHMLALAAVPVDWTLARPVVRREQVPPFGEGWVPWLAVEARRAA